MKLRNKKTGDIWEFDEGLSMKASQETAERAGAMSGSLTCFADSLADLNEEWEDYEEPKEFWYIGQDGVIFSDTDTITQDYADRLEAIDNYFETKEEAERAVEKLKAWKRLKDKGFEFTYWKKSCNTDGKIVFHLDELGPRLANFRDDLDLLFGGKE